ncbi:adp-ribose pyrophosphatase [Pyrrhoderma noxium]|uniref:Adp-ribose pyrophosphatase n=1 Tax=Pyrrhoderma noxium TaxID=2282107 RepID=A0A286UU78_9AGAM|nr:adp-ribose pyrophosphatase [Pyrrhoderma noxium]
MSGKPQILSSRELSASEAKWVTLKELKWKDEDGKERKWECAERNTRGSSGIDAVAILAIIKSQKNSFPPSTVIIEQFRPPVNRYVIELPAGLIDEGETAEQTAIRELEEETGFKSDKVIESSPVVATDPGMTTANMKLVILDVTLPDELELNEAKLDEGEHIVKRVVELSRLYDELQEYDKKGFMVDARLSHFASGYRLARQLRYGYVTVRYTCIDDCEIRRRFYVKNTYFLFLIRFTAHPRLSRLRTFEDKNNGNISARASS